MPISPGARLGSYEVLSPLGAGGMGELYRAGVEGTVPCNFKFGKSETERHESCGGVAPAGLGASDRESAICAGPILGNQLEGDDKE